MLSAVVDAQAVTPCSHVLAAVMLAIATCPRSQLPPHTGQLLLEGLAGVNTCFHHLTAPFMVYGRLGVKTGTQHVVYSLQASTYVERPHERNF